MDEFFKKSFAEALEACGGDVNELMRRMEKHRPLALQMAKLFDTLLSNAPECDDAGHFDMRAFVDDDAALALGYMLADMARKGKPDVSDRALYGNGMLYGVMLAELGKAKFIFREKSGKLEEKKPEKERAKADDAQAVIILGDMSGRQTMGEC